MKLIKVLAVVWVRWMSGMVEPFSQAKLALCRNLIIFPFHRCRIGIKQQVKADLINYIG